MHKPIPAIMATKETQCLERYLLLAFRCINNV